MSREYVIADTHFNHDKVIEYCGRPFKDVEEMNKVMIDNWNRVVTNNDKVYVLGDFGFGNKEKLTDIVRRLKGIKVLIMGNHDFRAAKNQRFWLDVGFNEVYKYPIVIKGNIILQHQPMEMMFSDTDFKYLYGHVHNSPFEGGETSFCVSSDVINFTPMLLDDIEILG